jgi:hypothetical protein
MSYTKCKKCGLIIAFKKLQSGKFSPINADGTDHFDACKKAQRNERPFNPNDPRDMKVLPAIRGDNYVPSDDDTLPW